MNIRQLPFSLGVIYTKPFEIQDEDGRAIGESKAPAECWIDVPLEWKTCPYSGSRNGKKMNSSALERLTHNLKEVFQQLAHMRAWYCKTYGKNEIELIDLWNMSFMTTNYPFFRYFKNNEEGTIRGTEADLYKVLLGLRPVLDTLNNTYVFQDNNSDKVTAEQIVQVAELNKSFIGGRGVCAGPPKMIAKSFDILLNDQSGVAEKCYFSKFGEKFSVFASSIKAAYFLQKIYALGQFEEIIVFEKKVFGHCWFFDKEKRFIHTYLKFLKIALPYQILFYPKEFKSDTIYRKRLMSRLFDIVLKDPTMPISVIEAFKEFQKLFFDTPLSSTKKISEFNNSDNLELFIQRIKLRDEKYKEILLMVEKDIAESLNLENKATKAHIDMWRARFDFPSLKQMLDIIDSDTISKRIVKLRLMVMHNIFFK